MTFDRASWIAKHLLPHEAEVRRWIASRARIGRTYDVDDVIQEAYARIGIMDLATISHPKAYFFRTARNLILEHLQRERIVPIEGMADFDLKNIQDHAPGPEHIVSARQDLKRFEAAIETLPPQCREVFLLGKVVGLSQKDIAIRMRLAESTVEKHLSRALRLMLQRYETAEPDELATASAQGASGREASR